MRISRLKLNQPFRSLHAGFECHFRKEWQWQGEREQSARFAPFVCAGPNGSGKSNILEALANIFFTVETRFLGFIPKTEDLDNNESQSLLDSASGEPDAYELEYFIPVKSYTNPMTTLEAKVLITKEAGKRPKIDWLNRDDFNRDRESDRQEAKELLPDYVVGYSSGENEILSLPFFKMRFVQLDEYFDYLNRGDDYPGQPESNMVYLDNSFSQAILICLFLYYSENELEPFSSAMNLEQLNEFRIILRHSVPVNPANHKDLTDSIIEVLSDDEAIQQFALPILDSFDSKGKAGYQLIKKLKNCCTCSYLNTDSNELILDYYVNDATRTAFRNNFSTPLELFQTLQTLLTLNLYSVSDSIKQDVYSSASHYVKETIPSLASDERVMRFKYVRFTKAELNSSVMLRDLSDGEHQLLHSLGLCLLFKGTNSLMLLDEPETHFNPAWRASFISQLNTCFKDEKSFPETLITTHSPFLISDSKPEHVLEFSKEEESNKVLVTNPDYNTFGASINKITIKTFNKKETIGGQAQTVINNFRKQAEKQNVDHEALIAEINLELGDSVEKVMLIKDIIDRMEEGK